MPQSLTDKPEERIFAKSRIFELVQLPQSDGRIFEVARRAPGVRLVIANKAERTLLLTREFRRELNDYDYRLSGGKVFDTIDEYIAFRDGGGDIREAAKVKAKAEGSEEAGLDIEELEEFAVSTLGTTVEWDLYVFEVGKWSKNEVGQQLEAGEDITADEWFAYDQVENMILSGKMQEERIALILLRWIKQQGKGENDEV